MPKDREDVLYARIPAEMKAELQKAAVDEDLKEAQLVRRIIREWLERRGKERAHGND